MLPVGWAADLCRILGAVWRNARTVGRGGTVAEELELIGDRASLVLCPVAVERIGFEG